MSSTKYLTILGRITATTYEVLTSAGPPPVYTTVNKITTSSTSRLSVGMSIEFLSAVGGLSANTRYYIISDGFTSTEFKVSTSPSGSAVTLSDSSTAVSYVAYAELSSTVPTPSLIIDTVSSVVSVDYTVQLDRIATAIETVATNSTTLATNSTTMKNLANGTGIHFTGPYEWLSMSSLYKLYKEQKVDIQKLKQDFEAAISKDF